MNRRAPTNQTTEHIICHDFDQADELEVRVLRSDGVAGPDMYYEPGDVRRITLHTQSGRVYIEHEDRHGRHLYLDLFRPDTVSRVIIDQPIPEGATIDAPGFKVTDPS